MRIEDLELGTPALATAREFYCQCLGLPLLASGSERFTVAAGATRLTWRQAVGGGAHCYHFAFNIPENRLDDGIAWLEQRGLAHTECYDFESWNADAVYFSDPDGNILELIARHTLPCAAEEFSLLSVSEIGWVVDDVPAAVAALGLPIYKGASPTFTAVGDEEGLVILVQTSRVWFASGGIAAAPAPFVLNGTPFAP